MIISFVSWAFETSMLQLEEGVRRVCKYRRQYVSIYYFHPVYYVTIHLGACLVR